MAHQEHASMEAVEARGCDSVRDRTGAHPDRDELRVRDHAVLPRRQRGDPPIGANFSSHNAAHVAPIRTCTALCLTYIDNAAHPR
jgi:hypothetical protein